MAVSNNTFGDFSFELFDKARVEEADFYISNQIESLLNTLVPCDSTATNDSETNIYRYNRDSQREMNEEKNYRNQMIDLHELLVYHDMDANAPQVEHVPLSEYIANNIELRADSDETRGGEADFHISNQIESLRNALDPCDSTATTGSETNVYGYNRDSRGGTNEKNDCRNQMIDLPMLLVYHDMDANAPQVEHVPLSEYIGNNIELHADFDETRGGEADFHISNQIESLRNTLDPCDSSATTGSETNVYGYNRDSRGETNEKNDCRNQMIDLPMLLVYQDIDANDLRVEHVPLSGYIGNNVESHADSVAIGNTCDIVEDAEKRFADKLTTSFNRPNKNSGLIKRYCSKCKEIVVGAAIFKKQLCAKCETPLSYQCFRCDKEYSIYKSLVDHLDRTCDPPNLELKCPECAYRSRAKTLMSKHISICLSSINFSCGFCVYTSKIKEVLLTHMRAKHKGILKIGCSQCETKRSKCKQCKNMVTICESCHTGLGSTDRFQEHQKSCKQTVLKCKYCPYKTKVNKKLKMHIRLEHLSALMSQALPTQD